MLAAKLLKLPGFLYEVNGSHYYLGKWICKECTEIQATDCVMMYNMCRSGHEEPDTNMYFQKIRALSDFALDIPYNAAQIKEDINALVDGLSEAAFKALETQVEHVEEDLKKYC